jgi:hypothetical protein
MPSQGGASRQIATPRRLRPYVRASPAPPIMPAGGSAIANSYVGTSGLRISARQPLWAREKFLGGIGVRRVTKPVQFTKEKWSREIELDATGATASRSNLCQASRKVTSSKQGGNRS